jgi:hypothetical protein
MDRNSHSIYMEYLKQYYKQHQFCPRFLGGCTSFEAAEAVLVLSLLKQGIISLLMMDANISRLRPTIQLVWVSCLLLSQFCKCGDATLEGFSSPKLLSHGS